MLCFFYSCVVEKKPLVSTMSKKASSSMSDQIMDYVRSDYFKRAAAVTGAFLLAAVVVYLMIRRKRQVTGDDEDPAPTPHTADRANGTGGAHAADKADNADNADNAHQADEERAVVADQREKRSKSDTLVMRTR